jgi:hypothetical protein
MEAADILGDVTDKDAGTATELLKVDSCPKQMSPGTREENARVPEMLEEKHLTEEERQVMRPVLLEYQDLFNFK